MLQVLRRSNSISGLNDLLHQKALHTPIVRLCSVSNNVREYAKCYRILEIPNNSDQETVRRAFIELCKKYHPDTSKSSGDCLKFQEIESAYRFLQNKFAAERWNVNEGIGEYGLYYKEKEKTDDPVKPEVFDIKHTAPQHRQYLSYNGIGSGTPSQREKQYVKYRTVVAAGNVHDHHIKKLTAAEENSLLMKDKHEAKKVKTRYGMDRLVEDLIQESMAKGHFDNLKGQGKPLPQTNYNPYVDYTTHKINQIMIENGFVPEWINLQKEIIDETDSIKRVLIQERKKLGPHPLNIYEVQEWKKVVESLQTSVQKLNSKINKFNLVVPMMNKQKIYFNLERESCDILKMEFTEKNVLSRDKMEVKDGASFSDFFSFTN
ncbi:hypothetical protein RUM43_014034 [Polyplax serrata]|uniref:J domain-containing protein n=1 Tax=Polyplax serrata TaxID=468196 RepID=A0AAN8RZP4_POLSC